MLSSSLRAEHRGMGNFFTELTGKQLLQLGHPLLDGGLGNLPNKEGKQCLDSG